MDGTLLQSNNQIGEETKQALKKVDEAGIKVVPASGNHCLELFLTWEN